MKVTITQLNKLLRQSATIVVLLALYACTPPTTTEDTDFALRPDTYENLPGWGKDDLQAALIAFQHSCTAINKKADHKAISDHKFAGTAADWKPICQAAKSVNMNDAQAMHDFFEKWFKPVEVKTAQNKPGLFTGYFEPTIYASKKRHGKYQYPVYARPSDLVNVDLGKFQAEYLGRSIAGRFDKNRNRLIPYYSRAEIDKGALKGKNLEILWAENKVDLFFLEVQGSGRAILDTGETLKILYDGKNGLSYTSIGKVLINKGYLKPGQASMQAIKAFFKKNPNKIDEILNHNKSYVFFRLATEPHIYGSQNVPLTAERSLAVDKHYLPMGIPIWLNTQMPATHNPNIAEKLQRLMVAQDTGGMIRGPIRGDIFWGHGETASIKAGHMKYPGNYWLLLPKSITL